MDSDTGLDKLVAVLEGEVPVWVRATGVDQIKGAIDWVEEEGGRSRPLSYRAETDARFVELGWSDTGIEASVVYFKAWRCNYLAQAFLAAQKWPEAMALFQRAVVYANKAKGDKMLDGN